MNTYEVTVSENVTNVYTVRAESKEEAETMEDILDTKTYSSESMEVINVKLIDRPD